MTVNGVIVFENANGPAVKVLDFRGNVSPANIPDTAEFADVRRLAKGLAIAAPTASVTMSGSVRAMRLPCRMTRSALPPTVSFSAMTLPLTLPLGADPTLIDGKTVHFVGYGRDNPPYQADRVNTYFRTERSTYREVPQ